MTIASNEKTGILELQEEARKKRAALLSAASSDGNGTSTKSLGDSLSSYLNELKNPNNLPANNKNGNLSNALSSFLLSLRDNKGKDNGNSDKDKVMSVLDESRSLGAFNFLKNNGSIEQSSSNKRGFDEKALYDYLKSDKLNTIKYDEIDIDLSKLINVINGSNRLDKDTMLRILSELSLHKKSKNTNIYESFLKNLDLSKDVIDGLDAFIASSAFLEKPSFNEINIDTEIIKTNFTIVNNIFIERPILFDSNHYLNLDSSLMNLPEVIELKNSLDLLKNLENRVKYKNTFLPGVFDSLKVIDKTNKSYRVPNWAYERNRKSIDMKVKQLNRLSITTNKEPLKGDAMVGNDFTKSLNNLLKFASSGTADSKEGFFQGGLAIDELRKIRRDMSKISVNSNHFISNADNSIMKFSKEGFVTYSLGTLGNPLVLPSIDLGNFNISKKPLSTLNGNYGELNPDRTAFYHEIYNTSVEALKRKAPDFRQNMYHGIFIYTKPDGIGKIQSFSELTNSLKNFKSDKSVNLHTTGSKDTVVASLNTAYNNILDTYFVRMNGITVPGANIESYSIKFLNRNIKKVGNNFNENHKITIDFSIDESGLILRSFDILTGNFGYIKDKDKHNVYTNNIFPVDFSPENKGRLDLVITYNDFRINPAISNIDTPSKSSFMPATQNIQQGERFVLNRNGSQIWGDPNAYRQFILEDVKILGMSGKVQFKRDDAGKTTVPVDLMFRRITTVDNNLLIGAN